MSAAAPTVTAGRVRTSLPRLRDSLPAILMLVLILGLWQLIVVWNDISPIILPSPTQIVSTIWAQRAVLLGDLWVTSAEVIFGLVSGISIGIIVGILIAYSKPVERLVLPLVITSQTVPIFAIAPLLVIWFGFGITPKLIIVAIGVFFPITVNQVAGLRSVDIDVINLLRAHRASNFQIFRYVRFPASLPYLFAGIQVGVTFSVIGAVFAEWVGADSGIGAYMEVQNALNRTDRVFAAIVVTSVVTILLVFIAQRIGRLLMPWRTES